MKDWGIDVHPNVTQTKTDCMFSADDSHARVRHLDDEELGSEDDEDRSNRLEDGVDGDPDQKELYEHRANILTASIGRNPGPQPSDGEV